MQQFWLLKYPNSILYANICMIKALKNKEMSRFFTEARIYRLLTQERRVAVAVFD
jgi:hypothetical protein